MALSNIISRKEFRIPIMVITILLILISSYVFFYYRYQETDNAKRKELLSQLKITEKVVLWRRLGEFKRIPSDTSISAYKQLKEQINLLISGNNHFLSASMLGKNSAGKMFYYLSHSIINTDTLILPGTILNDQPDFVEVFNSGTEKAVGPYYKNGSYVVSGIVPLIDPYTKDIEGVFVVDQNADGWHISVLRSAVVPIIIPVLIFLLLLRGLYNYYLKKEKKNRLNDAEKMRKETQLQFDKIMSVLEDIIYVVDAETEEFSYLSPAFEKVLGYSKDDIAQMGGRRTFLARIIQDRKFSQQEEFFKKMRLTKVDEQPDWTAWWKCKNGKLLLMEDRWIEVIEDNKFIGTFGVLRNITDRVLTEEELEKEKLLFQTLMDNITDKIYFKDKESKFIRVNKLCASEFGLQSTSHAEGKTDYDFFTVEHALKARNDELKIMDNGDPLLNYDEKETWPNGSETWVSSTKMPLRNKSGDIIGTFGISRDISSKKKAEEKLKKNEMELRELNSMKDKLFSIVSHDLKNPFFNIMQFVSTLADDFDNFGEQDKKEMIKQLKTLTDNGYSLLENLLTWSKSQLNKISLDLRNVEIMEIIKNVTEAVNPAASIKEITLETHLNTGINVYCDQNFTSMILRNLVMNAVKFSKRKSKIIINVTESRGKIVFTVKDFGIGMPPQIKERLFKVDNNLKRKGTDGEPGTGLGLILCKDFIIRMNGEIWFESLEGTGTSFYFSLPCEKST